MQKAYLPVPTYLLMPLFKLVLILFTGPDGKAQKVNYYFINYKTFVNVVKYKLDLMRKRMETEERDATSRASFKCPSCGKTFTDLEVNCSLHLNSLRSKA